MKNEKFIKTMQRRIAVTAVGPSAVRNQGANVLYCIQNFLSNIQIAKIPKSNKKRFELWLDHKTNSLLKTLPVRPKPWGVARKSINLFLRDVIYNRYLYEEFKMISLQPYLEIPLDSVVVKGLKKIGNRGQLPRWPGLKKLNKSLSDQYQNFAKQIARQRRISRVDLDIFLWLENR